VSDDKITRKLRQQLDSALTKQKDELAIEILGKLAEADPKAPRWPHKRGELYRKLNKRRQAIDSYSVAVDLYVAEGFLARAIAMAKTIYDLDHERIDVLEGIDPEAARKLHRQQRPAAISTRPGELPGVADAGSDARAPRHAAVLAEDPHAPRARHAAVIAEDDAPPALRQAAHPQPARAQPATVTPPADARPKSSEKAATRNAVPAAARTEAAPKAKSAKEGRAPAAAASARRRTATYRTGEMADNVLELGDALEVAPDIMPHETRFSDAPPARNAKFELTEAELSPRKAARRQPSVPLVAPSAKKLSQLPLFPLFAELPLQAMVLLVEGSEMLNLEDGAIVVRRGEPADALFGIIQGSVSVIVNSRGKEISTTLSEGDVFGESCLLAGEKRNADVVAKGHLEAMKIPRATFNSVIGSYPRVADVLLELLTRRLLSNLLQTSPLFQEFDPRGRQELAKTFEIRRAAKGMVLSEAGKVMDGLYISLTGELEVTYVDGRPAERFGAGTMFGQASLLTRQPSDVNVRALANMLVLRLSTKAFQTSVMQYPGMLERVSDLASTSVARLDG